ncbi:unnamed protein product [Amoebophrya sp. A120]|nr:unnamed protein product [Amoebophrya sp. A120]|eukprot:GSA120T00016746001.1
MSAAAGPLDTSWSSQLSAYIDAHEDSIQGRMRRHLDRTPSYAAGTHTSSSSYPVTRRLDCVPSVKKSTSPTQTPAGASTFASSCSSSASGDHGGQPAVGTTGTGSTDAVKRARFAQMEADGKEFLRRLRAYNNRGSAAPPKPATLDDEKGDGDPNAFLKQNDVGAPQPPHDKPPTPSFTRNNVDSDANNSNSRSRASSCGPTSFRNELKAVVSEYKTGLESKAVRMPLRAGGATASSSSTSSLHQASGMVVASTEQGVTANGNANPEEDLYTRTNRLQQALEKKVLHRPKGFIFTPPEDEHDSHASSPKVTLRKDKRGKRTPSRENAINARAAHRRSTSRERGSRGGIKNYLTTPSAHRANSTKSPHFLRESRDSDRYGALRESRDVFYDDDVIQRTSSSQHKRFRAGSRTQIADTGGDHDQLGDQTFIQTQQEEQMSTSLFYDDVFCHVRAPPVPSSSPSCTRSDAMSSHSDRSSSPSSATRPSGSNSHSPTLSLSSSLEDESSPMSVEQESSQDFQEGDQTTLLISEHDEQEVQRAKAIQRAGKKRAKKERDTSTRADVNAQGDERKSRKYQKERKRNTNDSSAGPGAGTRRGQSQKKRQKKSSASSDARSHRNHDHRSKEEDSTTQVFPPRSTTSKGQHQQTAFAQHNLHTGDSSTEATTVPTAADYEMNYGRPGSGIYGSSKRNKSPHPQKRFNVLRPSAGHHSRREPQTLAASQGVGVADEDAEEISSGESENFAEGDNKLPRLQPPSLNTSVANMNESLSTSRMSVRTVNQPLLAVPPPSCSPGPTGPAAPGACGSSSCCAEPRRCSSLPATPAAMRTRSRSKTTAMTLGTPIVQKRQQDILLSASTPGTVFAANQGGVAGAVPCNNPPPQEPAGCSMRVGDIAKTPLRKRRQVARHDGEMAAESQRASATLAATATGISEAAYTLQGQLPASDQSKLAELEALKALVLRDPPIGVENGTAGAGESSVVYEGGHEAPVVLSSSITDINACPRMLVRSTSNAATSSPASAAPFLGAFSPAAAAAFADNGAASARSRIQVIGPGKPSCSLQERRIYETESEEPCANIFHQLKTRRSSSQPCTPNFKATGSSSSSSSSCYLKQPSLLDLSSVLMQEPSYTDRLYNMNSGSSLLLDQQPGIAIAGNTSALLPSFSSANPMSKQHITEQDQIPPARTLSKSTSISAADESSLFVSLPQLKSTGPSSALPSGSSKPPYQPLMETSFDNVSFTKIFDSALAAAAHRNKQSSSSSSHAVLESVLEEDVLGEESATNCGPSCSASSSAGTTPCEEQSSEVGGNAGNYQMTSSPVHVISSKNSTSFCSVDDLPPHLLMRKKARRADDAGGRQGASNYGDDIGEEDSAMGGDADPNFAGSSVLVAGTIEMDPPRPEDTVSTAPRSSAAVPHPPQMSEARALCEDLHERNQAMLTSILTELDDEAEGKSGTRACNNPPRGSETARTETGPAVQVKPPKQAETQVAGAPAAKGSRRGSGGKPQQTGKRKQEGSGAQEAEDQGLLADEDIQNAVDQAIQRKSSTCRSTLAEIEAYCDTLKKKTAVVAAEEEYTECLLRCLDMARDLKIKGVH